MGSPGCAITPKASPCSEVEGEERRGAEKSFHAVFRAWRDVCHQSMRTTVVSQTSGYIAPILPIILCAPKFLDGALTLGEVMQAASAFVLVQSALNWMVDNYPRLAEWVASARRVAALDVSLAALTRADATPAGRIERGDHPHVALRLRDVSVLREDGSALVAGAELAVMPGEKLLLTGAAGTGKSTLVRALAGAWPWGRGRIEVRAGAKLLVLPQRPYLPAGSLRRVVSYPDAGDSPARARSPPPCTRSISAISRRASTRKRRGTGPCPAGRSSVWPSRASSSCVRT